MFTLFLPGVCYTPLIAVVSAPPARDDLRASQCGTFVLPTREEEVFLKTATHSNLNLESEASGKRSSPSGLPVKMQDRNLFGPGTTLVLKG